MLAGVRTAGKGTASVGSYLYCRHLPRQRSQSKEPDMPNPLFDRITIEPGKCGGRPCLRTLRIRVKDVLDLLSQGASHAEILEDFPDLAEEDIRASLAWAAAQADHRVLVAA